MRPRETVYIELLKKQIEEQLSWGNSDAWANADLEKLSELMFEKTGINLSVSTLKRVWGKVKYDSAPTATTLNTLAQFSGHESWRSFCSKTCFDKDKTDQVAESDKPTALKSRKPLHWVVAGTLLAAVSVLAVVWLSFFKNSMLDTDPAKIVFNSRAVSDELPNSVVFNYDVGKITADSVIIQQSWDPRRREAVSSRQHQHTSIYYYPGFFAAKLLVDNRIVKEHEILIKTRGWVGITQPRSGDKPFYLSHRETRLESGGMQITAETLKGKTGLAVLNDIWTTFCNVKEFNVDPGNFTLDAILQNTSPKEAVLCPQVKINIITSDGFISLPLCAKGCTSAISLTVSDNSIDGKDHDLSALGCDFSKPVQLKFSVKNKQAVINLDGKKMLTVPYTRPFGKVVAVMVNFEGAGEMRDVAIK